jgi:cold shock CspA family protein
MQEFVDRLFYDRGFDFIRVEGKDGNIFFHMSSCVDGLEFDNLKAFDRVEFETFRGKRGLKAINIKRIKK